MPTELGKFSSGLGNTMTKLYKVGGQMLVFVFLGALLMLGGNYIPGTNPRFMVTVGARVTFVCLLLYAVPQMQVAGASRKMRDFCERIAGNWWERVTPVQGTALSWITIRALPASSTVQAKSPELSDLRISGLRHRETGLHMAAGQNLCSS